MVSVRIGNENFQVPEQVYEWMRESRDIREKAKQVRDAQSKYFRTRTKPDLDRSKALEQELDNLLAGRTPEKVGVQMELLR